MKEQDSDIKGTMIMEEIPCLEEGVVVTNTGKGRPIMFGTRRASYIIGSRARIKIIKYEEKKTKTTSLKNAPEGYKILGKIDFASPRKSYYEQTGKHLPTA